ncbi:MAG: hypothetical protein NZM25_06225 [Leptospiraceae bacterium]|nr:hypothetical protein [Leptospiraceae bacterium]
MARLCELYLKFILAGAVITCSTNLRQEVEEELYAGRRKGLILTANQTVAEKGTSDTEFKVYFQLEEKREDVTQEASFKLSNSQVLNIGQTGFGFALEIGVTEVYAEYRGLRSNILPFTVVPQGVLQIAEARSLDRNHNGLIDALYLRFNKKVRDATLNLHQLSLKLNLHKSLSLGSVLLLEDAVDDDKIYLTVTEDEFAQSGVRLTLKNEGAAIFDLFGNPLTTPQVWVDDGSPPVLQKARLAQGTRHVLLRFSEIVLPEGGVCPRRDFISPPADLGIRLRRNGQSETAEDIKIRCGGSLILVRLATPLSSSDELTIHLENPRLIDERGLIARPGNLVAEVVAAGGYFIQPHLARPAQHGSHSFFIPSGPYAGQFIVVVGNASRSTSLYDPFTGSFRPGPELPFLAYVGALTLEIEEGIHRNKFLTILGSGPQTALLDLVTLSYSEGPRLTAPALTGTQARRIKTGPHAGKYWVVLGFNSNRTNLYEPATGLFTEGPLLTGGVGLGSQAFELEDGDILVYHGQGKKASLFDAQSGLVSVHPDAPISLQAGSLAILLKTGPHMGKYLIFGGSSNQAFYLDPLTSSTTLATPAPEVILPGSTYVELSPEKNMIFFGMGNNTRILRTDSLSYDPSPPTNLALGIGAHSIYLPFGKFAERHLLILGGNSTAVDYVRQDNPNPTFQIGPSLVAHAYLGAHTIAIHSGIHAGKFLTIHGAGTATSIFDPRDEEFFPGPSLTGRAYDGAHSYHITVGPHNGKILIVHGNNSNKTSVYDPITNTMSVGPDLSGQAGEGACSISLSGGMVLTLHGGGANTTSIYQPAVHQFVPGPALEIGGNPLPVFGGSHMYTIEGGPHNGKIALVLGGSAAVAILNPAPPSLVAVLYQTGTVYHGGHTVKIDWGIHAGKYLSVHGAGNGINLFDPVSLTFTRVQNSLGESQFLTNLAYIGAHTVKIPSGIHAGKYMIVHAFASRQTSLYDPMTGNITPGPELSMPAMDGAHSIVYSGTKILTIHGSGNGTSKYQDSAGSYFAGPNLALTSFEGSHSVRIPPGPNYLLIHGAGTATSIFDAQKGTFLSGLPLSTSAFLGSHSVELTAGIHSGKILTYHGVNSRKTSLYDPVTNQFSPGPDLPTELHPGTHSLALSNGNILTLHGYDRSTTTLYHAATNSFSSGPALTGKIYPGSHSIKLETGLHAGKYLIWHCASLSSSIYDPVANSFIAGPTLPLPCSDGAHSIKLDNGKYLVLLSGGRNTALYDPIANNTSIGPTLIYPIYTGSHSFKIDAGVHSGKILTIAGNGQKFTNLFNPATEQFEPGPLLEGKAFAGAHSFKVEAGPYAGNTLVILGGGQPGINLYIP